MAPIVNSVLIPVSNPLQYLVWNPSKEPYSNCEGPYVDSYSNAQKLRKRGESHRDVRSDVSKAGFDLNPKPYLKPYISPKP